MGSIWVLSALCWPHETCYLGRFFHAVSLLDICEQNFDLISSRPSDIYYTITGSDNGRLIGSVVPRHYLVHYWPVVKNSNNFHANNAFENTVCKISTILLRPQCVNRMQFDNSAALGGHLSYVSMYWNQHHTTHCMTDDYRMKFSNVWRLHPRILLWKYLL